MENDALQQILMTASRERSERSVLRIIVGGLAGQPHVALARIWLTGPGDICATCRMRPECLDQSRCLHLAASSGRSLAAPGADWTRLDGDFRRFPVGVRRVGHIAATGVPLFVANTAEQSEWIARPEWAAREQIRSFAGQPLVFGSETLGVLAVFSRVELSEIDIRWLRLFADHAAVAIVNARAFEEIEQLKRRLELENEYLREEISQSQAFGDLVGSSPGLFVRHFCEQLNLPSRKLTRSDVERLARYDWPGNIRELQNVIERALIRSRGGRLEFELGEARQRLPPKPTASRAEEPPTSLRPSRVKANV